MKKLLALFAFALVTFTANAQSYTYDVNYDGEINITDITCLVNKILGNLNPGEEMDTSPLELSTRKLNLAKGSSEVVEIKSGSGSYNVHSCNEDVATASLAGTSITITAIEEGKTFITVTDTESGQSATIKVVVDGEATPSYLTCPDENHPHIIDLGLPSGTKWACCNVGAGTPEDYGGHYAWGETSEKSRYDWSTYIHCDGSEVNCHDLGSDIAGTYYDIAHVEWGGSWIMPTLDQIKELSENCTPEWITLNGIKGYRFTGINGGNIFLPAAGHNIGNHFYNFVGKRCDYWTSTQGPLMGYPSYSGAAYELYLEDGVDCTTASRFAGFSVRPVYTSSLILSMSHVDLTVGESAIVEISLGSGSYTVDSSDSDVATASLSGTTITVTGIALGYATMTVTDTSSGKSRTLSVKVGNLNAYLSCPDDHHPHLIDLGLPSGTKWACCNVGADTPEDFGGHYAWGETNEKSSYNWNTYIHCNGTEESCLDLGSNIAGTQYDVAHVKWGGLWQMPNENQILELIDNCSYEWITLSGVRGCQFTGSSGGSIFLPAADMKVYNFPNTEEGCGYYWSSTPHWEFSNSSQHLGFYSYSDDLFCNGEYRCFGLSVRPIVHK